MVVAAVTAAAAAVTAMGLLSVWLFRRMHQEDHLEETALRQRSLADFQAGGYTPDLILHCGSAPRLIQLLSDSRTGILRIDTLRNGGGSRRDVHFQDLLGCQLLENSVVVEQTGWASGSIFPSWDDGQDGRTESLRLMLYLNDDLEPVVGVDLLLSPVDHSDRLFQQAQAFAADVLSLTRRILESSPSQGEGKR